MPQLPPLDMAVVDVMAEAGARSDRPFQKCGPLVDRIAERAGVGRDAAFAAVVALGTDAYLPLPLIEGHGNFGDADHGPAEPQFLEVRLTPAGALATAHPEAGGAIALVDGDLHVGGTRPAFDPVAALAAIARVHRSPHASDAELHALVGPPWFHGPSAVEGPFAELTAGTATTFRVRASIGLGRSGGRPVVVLRDLPPGIGARSLAHAVSLQLGLAGPEGWEDLTEFPPGSLDLPIKGFTEGWDDLQRRSEVVVRLHGGTDADAVARALADVRPVVVDHHLQLPAPLAVIVRAVAAAVDLALVAELVAAASFRPQVRGYVSYVISGFEGPTHNG